MTQDNYTPLKQVTLLKIDGQTGLVQHVREPFEDLGESRAMNNDVKVVHALDEGTSPSTTFSNQAHAMGAPAAPNGILVKK